MNKLRIITTILGILIMFSMVVAMYFWTTYGNEQLSTIPVLVAAQNIEKGTLIDTNKHFTIQKINTKYLLANSLKENDKIILTGKVAKQYIPKNAQIIKDYFDESGFVLTEGEVVFKIPNNWIYVIPSTIRRGDKIFIYEIDSNIDKNLNVPIKTNEEGISTANNNLLNIRLSSNEPILETTVLYVKDSSNNEVKDISDKERLDATSGVSSIEIGCTKEEIEILEKKISEGMKFIIVYN